ncbi:MAG: MMPL family transporter, partial [Gammaproteobacteria bacterium]|nr:MMPL family transporter [Gammaproteobacteria bacterium]
LVREQIAADAFEGDTVPEIRVRYGGNYAIAVDEAGLIQKDVKFNLFFSLFAVSALYWLCYRRFAALLYSSVPLMVGQALTFALAFFVLGGLNASSSAFTALLMGLGTDFVIVVYARYVEERQKGKSLAEATELMIGETGLGVFTGAITSAGTFYAMCISQFRGLRDLGFLIGSGILLCAVAILFLLPAMIKWNEGVRRRKVDAVKKLHLQSFGLEHLIPFAAKYRALTIGLIALLTGGAAFLALRLDFDDTVRVLRSNRSPAFQVQQEISDLFGASLTYMMAIAEAP